MRTLRDPVDGGVVVASEEIDPPAELEPAHLAAALQMLLELATTEVATWGESVYQAMGFDGLRAERAAAIQHVDPGGGPRHAAVESLYNVLAAGARLATRPAAERVRAVAGNAARLRGHSRLARETMTLARLLKPGRGAEYQRVAGLVAWEEAGGGDAVAWLERAERLFCEKGEPMEVLDTRRLRTLLHAELGDDAEALWLAGTTAPAVVTTRPWLGARTALTEAFCLAARNGPSDRKEARMLLDQGVELSAAVPDEAERLHLAWLAARARARLRRDATAEEQVATLLPAAARLWPAGDLSLLRLDLCVCRTPGRHTLDLKRVEAELRSAVPAETVEAVIAPALAAVELLVDPDLPTWDLAAAVADHLRTFARVKQPSALRPIPFLVRWPQAPAVPHSLETH